MAENKNRKPPITAATVEHPRSDYINFNEKFEADLVKKLRGFSPTQSSPQAMSAADERSKFAFATRADQYSTVGNYNDSVAKEKSLGAALEKFHSNRDNQSRLVASDHGASGVGFRTVQRLTVGTVLPTKTN